MLLLLLCPDTRIICQTRASTLLLSRTNTAVDLMQWLVYSLDSLQSTEIISLTILGYLYLEGNCSTKHYPIRKWYRVLRAFATASSATDGALINIAQMPLLGILFDYLRFRTFCHPLKSQMGHRFACGFCRVHPVPGRRYFP